MQLEGQGHRLSILSQPKRVFILFFTNSRAGQNYSRDKSEVSLGARVTMSLTLKVKLPCGGREGCHHFFWDLPILVPNLASFFVLRGRATFCQHQESRPLGRSNTGSPRFTYFPSLCARSESGLTNLIGTLR